MNHQRKALLVSLPWASLRHPSIGLGILTAIARQEHWECKATYPAFSFAQMIGVARYEGIVELAALIGLSEHLFAVECFGSDALNSDEYIEDFLRRLPNSERARTVDSLLAIRDDAIPSFVRNCATRLAESAVDVIGFTATVNQLFPSLAVAKRLRELAPSLTIIMGGACVHGEMGVEISRSFPFLDYVFVGEAEDSFRAFLRHQAKGESAANVPGVAASGRLFDKGAPLSELDKIPIPSFDDYFIERDSATQRGETLPPVESIPFESSRGCSWGERVGCAFCGLNNNGVHYRRKSHKRIVEEVLTLSNRHSALEFCACDNEMDWSLVAPALAEIRNSGVHLKWHYEVRATLTRSQVASLASVGVASVQPGIESFVTRILRVMRKGTDLLVNVQLLKWLSEYQIHPIYNILVGFPGETPEDYERMLFVLPRLRHLPFPSGKTTPVHVHRFSAYHRNPAKFGISRVRPMAFYERLTPKETVDLDQIAYFFDHDLDNAVSLDGARQAVDIVISEWRTAQCRRILVLGAGFGQIQTEAAGEIVSRRNLNLLETSLLILADKAIALERLIELSVQETGHARRDVSAAISTLEDEWVLLRDEKRVVSTIPYARPQSESDLHSWIERWTRTRDESDVDVRGKANEVSPTYAQR